MATTGSSFRSLGDGLVASARCQLPPPQPGRAWAERYVEDHLGHLIERRAGAPGAGGTLSSPAFRGGQLAAEAALARFSVDGYARAVARPQVYPQGRRSTSMLSPWIRHGLLSLPRLWDHVEGGPSRDVEAFRAALLRQEQARHRYAHQLEPLAPAVVPVPPPGFASSARSEPPRPGADAPEALDEQWPEPVWDRRLGCLELTTDELEEDGWLPQAARQWLAGHWVERLGRSWRHGDDYLFAHLLDGSRAAGSLGWHEPAGAFTRWQVEAQAPGLCASCELVHACPIERPPAGPRPDAGQPLEAPAWLGVEPGAGGDSDLIAGPVVPDDSGRSEAVWVTAESMGDADPALAAHPDLPAVFVFDEPLLGRVRLSAKRLVFLAETIADLATRRPVEVWLGDPVAVLSGRPLAVTFTPVPGWRRRSARLDVAALHPWPWLRRPPAPLGGGSEPVAVRHDRRRQPAREPLSTVAHGRTE